MRIKKTFVQKLEALSLEDQRKILLEIRKNEKKKRAHLAELIRDGRRRQLCFGQAAEDTVLSSKVLANRSQKALERARAHQKDALRRGQDFQAEFVDYEWLIINRPETCPECKKPMLNEKELAVVHHVPMEDGGWHIESNLGVVHMQCHRQAAARQKAVARKINLMRRRMELGLE